MGEIDLSKEQCECELLYRMHVIKAEKGHKEPFACLCLSDCRCDCACCICHSHNHSILFDMLTFDEFS